MIVKIVMNANRELKKIVIRGTVTALSVMAITAGAFTSLHEKAAEETHYEPTGYATAGIVRQLSVMESEAFENASLTVDEAQISVVAAAFENAAKESTKTSKWDSRLMADVDDFVYVRASAGKDGEILYKERTIVREGA